ncbi:hypothetical protein YIM_37010 [Amycolatopsis sp. YIM 10]|nr:hypothetical protein YIM_37010 [Amycolatopsis sp. YIM 10]
MRKAIASLVGVSALVVPLLSRRRQSPLPQLRRQSRATSVRSCMSRRTPAEERLCSRRQRRWTCTATPTSLSAAAGGSTSKFCGKHHLCGIAKDQVVCQGPTEPVPSPPPGVCDNPSGPSWGYGMYVDPAGKVDFLCAGGLMYGPSDGNPDEQDVLDPGRSLSAYGFTCAGEGPGIRCPRQVRPRLRHRHQGQPQVLSQPTNSSRTRSAAKRTDAASGPCLITSRELDGRPRFSPPNSRARSAGPASCAPKPGAASYSSFLSSSRRRRSARPPRGPTDPADRPSSRATS